MLSCAAVFDNRADNPLTKPTPTLRKLIEQYSQTLKADELEAFLEHILKLALDFRVKLLAEPPGPSRARVLHVLMEQSMVEIGPDAPSCCRGCGACCHLEVEITLDEGKLLAQTVEAGHLIDRDRLASQAARQSRGPEWAAIKTPANRCVFLGDDGACSVYLVRPASCRKLLVVSHPSECGVPGGKPLAITIPLAEVLLSTMLSLPGTEILSLSKAVTAGLLLSR